MKKLVWRLGKLPSPDEVRELVKDKIITQDEAREILFNTQTDEERDSESLKDEIKFLRELVDKLSTKETITKYIETVIPRYYNYGWAQPYQIYCSTTLGSAGITTTSASSLNSSLLTGSSGTNAMYLSTSNGSTSFSDISTF